MRYLGLLVAAALSLPSSALAAASFIIEAEGSAFKETTPALPVGGNDARTLGAQRLAAVKYAAGIWAKLLDSPVPITIKVRFDDLTCGDSNSLTLAQTHVNTLIRLEPGLVDGVTDDVWYPPALANRLRGVDLHPGEPDIEMDINSAVDRGCTDSKGWYYGFDGNATGRNDLIDTLIHEFAHGLGFSGQVSSYSGALIPGGADAFTTHLVHVPSGRKFVDLTKEERLVALRTPRTIAWSGAEVQKEASRWLRPGAMTLTLDPHVTGFSSWMGEGGVGSVPSNLRVRGRLMFVSKTAACSENIDGSNAIVLVEVGRCQGAGLLDRVRRSGPIAIVLVMPASSGINPISLAESETTTLSIPVLTMSAVDGELIAARLQTQSIQGSLEANPQRLSGADAMGRPFFYTNNPSDPGSNLSHFDTLPRPDLLMEPYARAKTTHNVDLTHAILIDIGWKVTCGNGKLDPGEQCDEGAANSDRAEGTCRTTCRMASCGDGIVVEGEECDDGFENSDVAPDACRTTCQSPRCGDHVVDEGELCDGDADCNTSCTSKTNATAKIPVWKSDEDTTIKSQATKSEGCSLAARGQSGDLTLLLLLTVVASLAARRRPHDACNADGKVRLTFPS